MAQDQSKVEVYRVALKEARTSFDYASNRVKQIALESSRLNTEMGRLRRTITALAAMCSESPWMDALGITDSCMEVMEAEADEVTTVDVVKKLEEMGFELSSQKNPAASVHAVLSRLCEKGKIVKVTTANGSVSWQGPNYNPDQGITDDDIPF